MADSRYCDGCLREDEEITADSWCSNCAEFVCEPCGRAHSKFASPHKLVSLYPVPNHCSSVLELCRNCKAHPGHKIFQFCTAHNKIICSSCVKDFHATCKTIISIEKAAEQLIGANLLEDLEKTLKHFYRNLEALINQGNETSLKLKEQVKVIKTYVADKKKQIIAHLDKIQAEIEEDLNQTIDDCLQTVDNQSTELTRSMEQFRYWEDEIKYLQEQKCDVTWFQATKMLEYRTHHQEKNVRNIKLPTPVIEFAPSTNLAQFENLLPSFGSLFIQGITGHEEVDEASRKMFVTHIENPINMSLVASFKAMQIGVEHVVLSACFVSEEKLLLSDYDKKCVYLCNHDGSHYKRIKLGDHPVQVTNYDQSRALVTTDNNGVKVVDLNSQTLHRCTSSVNDCWAISSNNGKIWVRTQDNNLVNIDIRGKVLKRRNITNPILKNICVGYTGTVYCTTYLESNKIYSVTADGEFQVFYKCPNQVIFSGITINNAGDIIVAEFSSNSIYRISSDGKQCVTILTAKNGLSEPSYIDYNKHTDELLVVHEDDKAVSVFKMS